MYVIMVDYYHWSEEKGEYTLPMFLNVKPPHRIFTFTETINDDTKRFATKKEAKAYIEKHFKDEPEKGIYRCTCFENIRIIKIA